MVNYDILSFEGPIINTLMNNVTKMAGRECGDEDVAKLAGRPRFTQHTRTTNHQRQANATTTTTMTMTMSADGTGRSV
jgi:hypothetical protein